MATKVMTLGGVDFQVDTSDGSILVGDGSGETFKTMTAGGVDFQIGNTTGALKVGGTTAIDSTARASAAVAQATANTAQTLAANVTSFGRNFEAGLYGYSGIGYAIDGTNLPPLTIVPGYYLDNDVLVTTNTNQFAGAVKQPSAFAGSNAGRTNYVYWVPPGSGLVINQRGFPAFEETQHIRICTLVCKTGTAVALSPNIYPYGQVGAYTALSELVDCRDQNTGRYTIPTNIDVRRIQFFPPTDLYVPNVNPIPPAIIPTQVAIGYTQCITPVMQNLAGTSGYGALGIQWPPAGAPGGTTDSFGAVRWDSIVASAANGDIADDCGELVTQLPGDLYIGLPFAFLTEAAGWAVAPPNKTASLRVTPINSYGDTMTGSYTYPQTPIILDLLANLAADPMCNLFLTLPCVADYGQQGPPRPGINPSLVGIYLEVVQDDSNGGGTAGNFLMSRPALYVPVMRY